LIEIQNVSKWYGDLQVLNDITEEVKQGQTVVICGPSGSGKSTLLRCINGLEPFQKGEIIVDGVSVNDPSTNLYKLRTEIGMVFQRFELYPHMTALQNITLAPMKARNKPRREAEAKAMELLQRVGIPEKAHEYPANLSGGQQQRVAIASSPTRWDLPGKWPTRSSSWTRGRSLSGERISASSKIPKAPGPRISWIRSSCKGLELSSF